MFCNQGPRGVYGCRHLQIQRMSVGYHSDPIFRGPGRRRPRLLTSSFCVDRDV